MRVFLPLLALPLCAANLYIRPGGAGSADGSDWNNACPWFTSGSCATPVRGNTYYVAGGTYNNATVTLSTANSGTTLITIKKANAAENSGVAGWDASFASTQAVFNQSAAGSPIITFQAAYWVLNGVTGGGPGSWKTGHGFKFNATRQSSNVHNCVDTNDTAGNISISHIECVGNSSTNGEDDNASGGSNDGIAITDGDNYYIGYNYIHDQGRCNIFWRGSNSTIEYNYLTHNESTDFQHSEMIAAEASGDTAITNVTFRFNMFVEGEGTGALVMHCDGCKIYGNVFWKERQEGFAQNGVVTTWSASDARNNLIYNNVFADHAVPGVQFPDSSTSNTAYNNIFYNNAQSFTGVGTHDYNWFFNSGGTFGEANAQAGSGDPFTNLVGEDFTLTAATNAGTTLGSPYNTDPTGATRGADGTWDRGAYEFQAGGSTSPRFGGGRFSGKIQ